MELHEFLLMFVVICVVCLKGISIIHYTININATDEFIITENAAQKQFFLYRIHSFLGVRFKIFVNRGARCTLKQTALELKGKKNIERVVLKV